MAARLAITSWSPRSTLGRLVMAPRAPPYRTDEDRLKRIVVSPHLDDAVLSCGGQLGPETTAVTVFAGAPPPGTPLPEWDRLTGASDPHAQVLLRRSEDAEALRRLGAAYRHLDF